MGGGKIFAPHCTVQMRARMCPLEEFGMLRTRMKLVALLSALTFQSIVAAQCLGCAATASSAGGTASCITVTTSHMILQIGECDEDESGSCFSNTATDQTCRYSYSMSVDVEGCCWQWKHEICGVANNGTRSTCATNNATICGDSSFSGLLDLTCGTEWRASASIGGAEIGYVRMTCNGCLPAPG